MMDIIAAESQFSSGVYAKRDLVIVSGKGATLFDYEGREYIDCVAGQGVANLGHAHPAILEAITEQSQKLITCPEMFYSDRRAALVKRLAQVAPAGLSRSFLCNSGTEAVEAALKFARVSTGRQTVIAAMRGFHGRTFGALSATWKKSFRQPFEPLVPGFTHVPYNKPERLEDSINGETAAVILEVIQGEGGVHTGTVDYLQGAQALCREHGALLIIDEIQTGYGRTGTFLALEHYNLQPDLVCLAKSMAGGLPMGAVLIGERVGVLPTGSHGSTFGGNPLSCAAALAVLETMESEDLPARAAKSGAYLFKQLEAISSPVIREVRGRGLMVGIEIKTKVAPYIRSLMDEGVLALPAGLNVIRLLPPLVITHKQIDRVVEALEHVLSQEPNLA